MTHWGPSNTHYIEEIIREHLDRNGDMPGVFVRQLKDVLSGWGVYVSIVTLYGGYDERDTCSYSIRVGDITAIADRDDSGYWCLSFNTMRARSAAYGSYTPPISYREVVDLLIRLCLVSARCLLEGIDDATKRYALMELDDKPSREVPDTADTILLEMD